MPTLRNVVKRVLQVVILGRVLILMLPLCQLQLIPAMISIQLQ
jgi:hypothetical protein